MAPPKNKIEGLTALAVMKSIVIILIGFTAGNVNMSHRLCSILFKTQTQKSRIALQRID